MGYFLWTVEIIYLNTILANDSNFENLYKQLASKAIFCNVRKFIIHNGVIYLKSRITTSVPIQSPIVTHAITETDDGV